MSGPGGVVPDGATEAVAHGAAETVTKGAAEAVVDRAAETVANGAAGQLQVATRRLRAGTSRAAPELATKIDGRSATGTAAGDAIGPVESDDAGSIMERSCCPQCCTSPAA